MFIKPTVNLATWGLLELFPKQFSLTLDLNKYPYKQIGGAGVLTPMAALGDVYIECVSTGWDHFW